MDVIVVALAVPIALVVAACLVRDRAAAALAEARRGFAILASPRAYLRAVALPQVMAWMLRVLAMYCFLHAFHIDGQMNHAALALVAGSVTTLVPLTPGGVGTQQALLVVLLAGVAAPAAVLSFSLGTQLVITVVNVTLGGACMALMLGTVPWRMRVPAAGRAGSGAGAGGGAGACWSVVIDPAGTGGTLRRWTRFTTSGMPPPPSPTSCLRLDSARS